MFFFKNVLSQKRCYSGVSVAYQGQSGMRSTLYEESLLVSHSPELSQQKIFYNSFVYNRNKDLENHCTSNSTVGLHRKKERKIFTYFKKITAYNLHFARILLHFSQQMFFWEHLGSYHHLRAI